MPPAERTLPVSVVGRVPGRSRVWGGVGRGAMVSAVFFPCASFGPVDPLAVVLASWSNPNAVVQHIGLAEKFLQLATLSCVHVALRPVPAIPACRRDDQPSHVVRAASLPDAPLLPAPPLERSLDSFRRTAGAPPGHDGISLSAGDDKPENVQPRPLQREPISPDPLRQTPNQPFLVSILREPVHSSEFGGRVIVTGNRRENFAEHRDVPISCCHGRCP